MPSTLSSPAMPSMPKKRLGNDVWIALSRLATSYRQLRIDIGGVDTKSAAGYAACEALLADLCATANAFGLEPAPRTYRMDFTVSYRTIFPDQSRSYRVDMLQASMEQHAVIWVNGEKFEFSAEAMSRAEALQRCWLELTQLLESWGAAPRAAAGAARPSCDEFCSVLGRFDVAWARFEEKYISELIGVEERARGLVLEAVKHEHRLHVLEALHGLDAEMLQDIPEYLAAQRKLVLCICHLNSVANHRGKGRDDLGVDVLRDAVCQLSRSGDADRCREMRAPAAAAARLLATNVVESFAAVRGYLRQVGTCIERVDPHLSNNAGLVAKLVDWEESWEVGARYVQHQPLLAALCEVVAEVRGMERAAPELTTMLDECDVELFLVLPRIVWMSFLSMEAAALPGDFGHTELLRSMLPHRFGAEVGVPDRDLEEFVQMYKRTRQAIVTARAGVGLPGAAPADAAASFIATQRLAQRVVTGSCKRLASEEADTSLQDFMRELERWSMELQRHCPEDWNRCSAILVQCLAGGSQK